MKGLCAVVGIGTTAVLHSVLIMTSYDQKPEKSGCVSPTYMTSYLKQLDESIGSSEMDSLEDYPTLSYG